MTAGLSSKEFFTVGRCKEFQFFSILKTYNISSLSGVVGCFQAVYKSGYSSLYFHSYSFKLPFHNDGPFLSHISSSLCPYFSFFIFPKMYLFYFSFARYNLFFLMFYINSRFQTLFLFFIALLFIFPRTQISLF